MRQRPRGTSCVLCTSKVVPRLGAWLDAADSLHHAQQQRRSYLPHLHLLHAGPEGQIGLLPQQRIHRLDVQGDRQAGARGGEPAGLHKEIHVAPHGVQAVVLKERDRDVHQLALQQRLHPSRESREGGQDARRGRR